MKALNYHRLKKQAGLFLIELAISMFILMVVSTIGLYREVRSRVEANSIAQSDALNVLNNAAATYQTTYFTELVNGSAIPGVSNLYAPTVAELATKVPLTNFSTSNFYGGGYGIQISRVPTGCAPSACDLQGLVYLTNAIKDPNTGLIDGASLGAAIEHLGANAGFSTPAAPGTIKFTNGTLTAMANPVTSGGVGVAGILAMRSGYGASGLDVFTRRDGTKKPTANWDMDSKSVTNINAVGSQTLATTGQATIGGTATIVGATTANGITNTGNITNTGTIANTGNMTNSGNLTNGGALTNTGAATLNNTLTVAGQTNTKGIANTGLLANTGNLSNSGTLTNTGSTTLQSTLDVAGQTTTKGIANTGNLTNTGNVTAAGDVSGNRLVLNQVVSVNASCAGLSGYQAVTAAGSIASCINGTWQTPSATTTPFANCSSTTVSFGGCQGTVPNTTHGNNAAVSMTYGTGNATYSCNNGSWAYVSGSCSVPCSSQAVSWSSCTGTASAANSGSSVSVSSYTSSTGSATFTCNSGSWTYAGGSCTAPSVGCSGQTVYWGSGCTGSLGSASHGGTSTATDPYAGSASYSCNNGSWSMYSSSCPSTYNKVFYYPQAYWPGGGKYAYITQDGAPTYCTSQSGSFVSSESNLTYGGTGIGVCWSVNGSGSSTSCTGGANCGPGQTFSSCNYWTSITCAVAR